MKFVALWDIKPERRTAAIHQFTAFAQKYSGINVLNRWHRADCSGGGMLFHADDAQAIAALSSAWSSLLDIYVSPIVEDSDVAFLQLFKS